MSWRQKYGLAYCSYFEETNLAVDLKLVVGDEGEVDHAEAADDAKVNRTVRIRPQRRKKTVLSCHSCLLNTGVGKINI